jgi:hypothetical protein
MASDNEGDDQNETTSYGLTAEQQQCLVDTVGEAHFAQMISGLYTPTATEQETLAEKCFSQANHRRGSLYVRPGSSESEAESDDADEPSDAIGDCPTKIFGDDVRARMAAGQLNPTAEQEQLMRECVRARYDDGRSERSGSNRGSETAQYSGGGDTPPPTRGNDTFRPTVPEITGEDTFPPISSGQSDSSSTPRDSSEGVTSSPAEIEDCKEDALDDNYDAYQRGQYYPTQDEYTKMAACYQN